MDFAVPLYCASGVVQELPPDRGLFDQVEECAPRGFIRVVDGTTLGFADYAGNRQYVTTGNLAENDRAFLFLMDYAASRRVKLWGRARVVEGDETLLASLMPDGYKARPEQVILFHVEAWDVSCSKHIPQKIDAGEVAAALDDLRSRLDTSVAENARLRAAIERLHLNPVGDGP